MLIVFIFLQLHMFFLLVSHSPSILIFFSFLFFPPPSFLSLSSPSHFLLPFSFFLSFKKSFMLYFPFLLPSSSPWSLYPSICVSLFSFLSSIIPQMLFVYLILQWVHIMKEDESWIFLTFFPEYWERQKGELIDTVCYGQCCDYRYL